jgi:hypothetical protein
VEDSLWILNWALDTKAYTREDWLWGLSQAVSPSKGAWKSSTGCGVHYICADPGSLVLRSESSSGDPVSAWL